MERAMLRRSVEFAARHRYGRPAWDEARIPEGSRLEAVEVDESPELGARVSRSPPAPA
jgi:hypothetical protein